METNWEAIRGALLVDGRVTCWTLEHPHMAIPAGTYPMNLSVSPTFRQHLWEIMDVPDRTRILLHAGNTLADTSGCILVGKSAGELGGKPAVLGSANALSNLMRLLDGQVRPTIEIKEVV